MFPYGGMKITEMAKKITAMRPAGESGKYYGRCPFCGDGTETFFTDDGTDSFFCYACGARGGKEALAVLLPGYAAEKKKTESDPVLTGIHTDAANFYYLQLMRSGNPGMKYLSGRGITRAGCRTHGLGYAPDTPRALYGALKGRYAKEDLMRSGLFRTGKDGRVYDFFRGRIMFPIRDASGNVAAFGGRTTDGSVPKYINSPETAIFRKHSMLYGFPYGEGPRDGCLILCEGYMDRIAVADAGIPDCAAALGTALGREQAELIASRYRKVCLAPDTDGPGVNAALEAVPLLASCGLSVTVADLRPAKDPDEFLKRFGKEPFEKRLREAVPAYVYAARHAGGAGDIVGAMLQMAM